MTDRKLLELAAKAEGHGVYFAEVTGLAMLDDKHTIAKVSGRPHHETEKE